MDLELLQRQKGRMDKSDNNIYIKGYQHCRELGLDVLPIPHVNGLPAKRPLEEGWPDKAANGEYSEEDFADECNLGVLTGGKKNVTDIDCDSKEAIAVAGECLSEDRHTLIYGRTSKPDSHYLYETDESLPYHQIKDPTDKQCVVEYRCVNKDGIKRGHQTVFPPSLKYDPKTGMCERINFGLDSDPNMAKVSARRLHTAYLEIGVTALLAKHFPGEGRHEAILALAGTFVRAGISEGRAVKLVRISYRYSAGYNDDRAKVECDVASVYETFAKDPDTHLYGYPRLTEIFPKAVVDKVLSLLGIARMDKTCDAGTGEPRNPEAAPLQMHLDNFSDAGNGRLLVKQHRDELRYCVDDGAWYLWDGTRWRKDKANKIREMAKDVSSIYRQAANDLAPPASTGLETIDKAAQAEYARKQILIKWANQTENAKGVSNTIISAQSDPEITCFRADFDTQPHLLNCPNGIVDLKTGTLMPHDRRLMLSNLCPVEYDPDATHPLWDQSLNAFTRHHSDLPPCLQKLAGYSLQGNKTEERILLLYGAKGNNGKGTFMDCLTSAFGPDYSCAMSSDSVLKQRRDSAAASGDIARLEGKRLVVVSEIEKGNRVQESFMKQASGNDSLVARGLYQSEREFRPTHQLWFQANYRPGFDSNDGGNRRRYLEIPFDNDLSKDPEIVFDRQLKNRLRQDPEVLKAVLAWAVQGAVTWHQEGLDPLPASVQQATDELFAHNDFLKEFLDEQCVVAAEGAVFLRDLWNTYRWTCERHGQEPAQGRTFIHMMEERGYRRRQKRISGKNGKAWVGLRLKTLEELKEEDRKLTEAEQAGQPVQAMQPEQEQPSEGEPALTVLNGWEPNDEDNSSNVKVAVSGPLAREVWASRITNT